MLTTGVKSRKRGEEIKGGEKRVENKKRGEEDGEEWMRKKESRGEEDRIRGKKSK